MKDTNPYYEKLSQPFRQAVYVLVLIIVIMLFSKLFQVTGLMDISDRFYWKTATAMLFFFAIFNSFLSLRTKNALKYWRDSMYSFILLAALGGFIAWQFSGINIYETGAYYAIYIVVAVGFLVFSTITYLMRKIVEYAENEKWEKPKERR